MCSFVLSRLDYCNSVIIDITSDQMYRLQKYSKACSQSRFSQKQTWAVIVSWCFQPSQPQRVASGLANMNMLHHFSKKLHWLPVKERIHFKITAFAFPFFDGTLPPNLSSSLSVCTVSLTLRSSCDAPEGRPGMSDVSPLSGISGLLFDSTLLSPLLFFCLVLLPFLSYRFLPAGPFF